MGKDLADRTIEAVTDKLNEFLSRAMSDISDVFKPLEDVIRADFLPALLRREVNDLERDMLSCTFMRYGDLQAR